MEVIDLCSWDGGRIWSHHAGGQRGLGNGKGVRCHDMIGVQAVTV